MSSFVVFRLSPRDHFIVELRKADASYDRGRGISVNIHSQIFRGPAMFVWQNPIRSMVSFGTQNSSGAEIMVKSLAASVVIDMEGFKQMAWYTARESKRCCMYNSMAVQSAALISTSIHVLSPTHSTTIPVHLKLRRTKLAPVCKLASQKRTVQLWQHKRHLHCCIILAGDDQVFFFIWTPSKLKTVSSSIAR